MRVIPNWSFERDANLKGDGLYSPTNRTFAPLRNFGEHLAWVNADGTPLETRNHHLYASGLVIGHREVAHEIQHALPDNER